VSATHTRHRFAVPFAGLVLAVGLLAGCAGQRAPSSYTSGVKRDFIKGCEATAKSDAKSGSEAAATISDPEEFCACAYAAVRKKVKFADFKKINDDLTEDNAVPPKSFTDAYADCVDEDQPAG
jgi:hypothetical protein